MTLSELRALCFGKIDEKNPLRLPDTRTVVHSPEEEQAALNEIVDQYAANCDYSSLLMDAISEVYATLYQELGLSREDVQRLPSDTALPPRTNELAEKLKKFPGELNDESTAEKVQRAFTLLGVTNFRDLSLAYTREDQKLMKVQDAWDDKDPTLITNQAKSILEGIDPSGLDEYDRVWWREIIWFWYHHAISCAVWKHKDRALAQQYADKAREIQGSLGHPNRITELLRLLVHNEVEEARDMVHGLRAEAYAARRLLVEYERGEFFT